VSELAKATIGSTIKHLAVASPRVLRCGIQQRPILVFVGGACEESCTSVGAVLVINGRPLEYFGARVSQATLVSWRTRLEQTQLIGQAEIFPMLLARLIWSKYLADNWVVYFGDNDSARQALVKAYSPILPSLHLVIQCVECDYTNKSTPWYARVPAEANIADAPSRLEASKLLADCGLERGKARTTNSRDAG